MSRNFPQAEKNDERKAKNHEKKIAKFKRYGFDNDVKEYLFHRNAFHLKDDSDSYLQIQGKIGIDYTILLGTMVFMSA
jgi:hypothetical protein